MSAKEQNFEAAIAELEETVKRMEDGNETLDELLSAYEHAVSLVRLCTEKLTAAEKRLTKLTGEEMTDDSGEK